jgi:hypothetical protein
MDAKFSRRLLCLLVENSVRILSSGFGVNRAESTFFEVIQLLREEPSLREYFLEMIGRTLEKRDASGLDSGDVPRELIELVAHELRWPELYSMAERRLIKYFHSDASLAVGDIASSLPLAYEESWPDREFYERYQAI